MAPTKPKLTLKDKGRRTITHTIPTDDDAVTAYAAAVDALNKARARALPPDQIADLEAARDAAEARVRETSLVVKMRAMPRAEYALLKAKHTPTDEDHKHVRESSGNDKAKARWHSATFGPALVAACMTEPDTITVDEATQLAKDWNEAEWDGLFYAAIAANEQSTGTAGLIFS